MSDEIKLAQQAAPLVEGLLRKKMESGGANHLKAIPTGQITEIAGKIVNMLPMVISAAKAAGWTVPDNADAAAQLAVDIFASFQHYFPSTT